MSRGSGSQDDASPFAMSWRDCVREEQIRSGPDNFPPGTPCAHVCSPAIRSGLIVRDAVVGGHFRMRLSPGEREEGDSVGFMFLMQGRSLRDTHATSAKRASS